MKIKNKYRLAIVGIILLVILLFVLQIYGCGETLVNSGNTDAIVKMVTSNTYIITNENNNVIQYEGYGAEFCNDNNEDLFSINSGSEIIIIENLSFQKHISIVVNNTDGQGEECQTPNLYILTDENNNIITIKGFGAEYVNDNKEDLFHITTSGCGITITEFSKKKHLKIINQ